MSKKIVDLGNQSKTSAQITLEWYGVSEAQERLHNIRPHALRKRILKQVSRQLVKSAKARITAQTDLDGAPFKPRADGSKRKLLTKNIRRLLKAIENGDEVSKIGYRNPVMSSIAAKQQYGFTQTVTKRKVSNRSSNNSSTDLATRKQAKALKEAGFKRRRENGRGWQTPTIKWITENITVGQAGVVLRILRGAKESWKITIPPRSFLGITHQDKTELSKLIQQEIDRTMSNKQINLKGKK